MNSEPSVLPAAEPIILDPGPSPRGWHRLQLAAECLSKYAHTFKPGEPLQPAQTVSLVDGEMYVDEDENLVPANEFTTSPALVKGSLFHLALAQHYMRIKEEQTNGNPEKWAEPIAALQRASIEKGPVAQQVLPEVMRAYRAYARQYLADSYNMSVVGVEELGETLIAGKYRLTGRMDLIYKDASGKIFVCDHKCLPGSTEIEGVPVSAYVKRNKKFPVRAFDGECVVQGEALVPVSTGVQPVWNLALANGTSIALGDNHPVWARKPKGPAKHNYYPSPPTWYRADALKPGDEVAIALGGSFPAQTDVSDAQCWVVGALLADGGLTQPAISMTKSNTNVRAAYTQRLDELGIGWREQTSKTRASAICFTTAAENFLTDVGMTRQLSSDKRFPEKFRALSHKQTGILIGALWSGDGAFYFSQDKGKLIPRITYGTRSKALAIDVQQALLRMGIPAFVQTTSVEYQGERLPYYYTTVVTKYGRAAFCAAVRNNTIPLVRHAVSLEDMEKVVQGTLGRGDGKIDGDLWWVKVDSNTRGEDQECFDIEVPVHHTFAVGSVITHNTSSRITAMHKLYYSVSGQLLGYSRMAAEKYGDQFGGFILNLVQLGENPSFTRLQLPRSPNLEKQFESRVKDIEESIDRLVAERRHYTEWPKAMSELTCYTRYGACKFVEQCRFGPGAQTAGNFKFSF